MQSTRINPFAVAVASICYFALGALWYSPLMFVSPWLRFIGKTFDEVKAHGVTPYPYAFLAAVLVSLVLARTLVAFGATGIRNGAAVGLGLGVALALATAAPAHLFEMRPLGLLAINAGYPVLGMTFAGAILGAWTSPAPDAATAGAGDPGR